MPADFIGALEGALEERRASLEDALGRVYEAHRGEPVAAVASALREQLIKIGMTGLTDEWITPYAEVISAGRRIVLERGISPEG